MIVEKNSGVLRRRGLFTVKYKGGREQGNNFETILFPQHMIQDIYKLH